MVRVVVFKLAYIVLSRRIIKFLQANNVWFLSYDSFGNGSTGDAFFVSLITESFKTPGIPIYYTKIGAVLFFSKGFIFIGSEQHAQLLPTYEQRDDRNKGI